MKDLLQEQIRRWRKDPVSFAHRIFRFQPTEQQASAMMAFAQPGAHVAVRSGHGVGKSTMMALLAIWLLVLFRNVKAAATANSAPQLKDVFMAEIGRLVSIAHPWVRDQLDPTSMRLAVKGAEATNFLSARTARPEKPDALQGFHAENMGFFIDEAFGVSDKIFEVAAGSLSTPGSRVILCGNPTATSGYAFEAFHRNKHLWKTFTFSCLQSPLVSKEYIDHMRSQYGEDSDIFKVRVLGEFPSTSVNQLIPRALAEASAAKKLNAHDFYYAPVVLGVDVAWEGDDRSSICLRQGLHSKILGVYRNIDNMRLGGLVNQFWTQHKADAVFVDVGWGTGVIDYLRNIGRNPIPVNFGGAPISPEYANKRTEMWCEMKKWLESGGSVEDNADLIEDLVSPEIYFLNNGKKILEKKVDMKKRGLSSPDIGDSLALTFASPVQKMSELHQYSNTAGKVQTEYDVLA